MSPSRSWGIARCMGWRERQVSQKLYDMLFLEYSYWEEDPQMSGKISEIPLPP